MKQLAAILLLATAATAFGQFADTYRQAAQAYNNAAAQCQSPAGAACLRQFANHLSCLANQLGGGGGCGAEPSCSTSCTSSSSGVGGGSLGTAGATLSSKQQLALAGLNLAITWLSNRHHNEPVSQTAAAAAEDDAQRAADIAAVQAAIAEANKESSDMANLRAALTSGADPSTLGEVGGQNADPATTIRNQLSTGGDIRNSPQQSAANGPPDDLARLRAQLTAQAVQQEQGEDIAPPTVPSMQELNEEEEAEADAAGPNWKRELGNLKDRALHDLLTASNPADPNSITHLDQNDYLETGVKTTIKDFLPLNKDQGETLGSVLQEKAVNIASDKVADTLTNQKDQLACSNQDSKIDRDACMIYMAPTNIGRGIYNYGTILVNRYGKLMDDVNEGLWGKEQ